MNDRVSDRNLRRVDRVNADADGAQFSGLVRIVTDEPKVDVHESTFSSALFPLKKSDRLAFFGGVYGNWITARPTGSVV